MVRLNGQEGNVSIDVAVARREFLLAMWTHAHAAMFLFGTIGNPENQDATSDQIADAWVKVLFNAEVPWLRDWARRAVNVIRLDTRRDRNFDRRFVIRILDAYAAPPSLVDSACSNAGDVARDLISKWQPTEWPPDGGFTETKQDFLNRMDEAFERRRKALLAAGTLPSYRPSLRNHAEWTVRRYLLCESVADIVKGRCPHRTVEKAVKEFAALVDLPPRPPKVALSPRIGAFIRAKRQARQRS